MLPLIGLSWILIAIGLLAGLARGGRIGNIAKVTFRWPGLVLAGLLIQIVAELLVIFGPIGMLSEGRGVAILGLSYLLLIVFAAVNIKLPGALLILAGLAMNLLVIAANGGMPVSLEASLAAGFDPSRYLNTALKHTLMGEDTMFWFLGDIIPIPWLGKVLSPGDVILSAGLLVLLERSVRYQPKRAIR